MLNVINTATAILAANLVREGRQVLFSPTEAFGTLPAGDFADMGLFPPDAKIAPSAAVDRSDIQAQNRLGGPPVTVATDVTRITVTYDIPVLTPDETVRALHNGAPPTTIAAGPLAGSTVSPYAPGGSITGRLIVVSRREGSDLVKVAWHPRAFLQSNGTGDNQNRETAQFTATVQAFDYTPGAELAAYNAQITLYGALFTVPSAKLQALLDILAGEALPAA
ncbi:hypothetical protein [Deinococcus apachensis]|uniref:hypothetical protein n=1 Tax=Deinococcus apachensis TaxID=309886 RepID=UPI000364BD1B|nr:hypothetical protein [Deinococcus apachensis]